MEELIAGKSLSELRKAQRELKEVHGHTEWKAEGFRKCRQVEDGGEAVLVADNGMCDSEMELAVEFAVTAWTALPAALDRVEQLEDENAVLKALLDDAPARVAHLWPDTATGFQKRALAEVRRRVREGAKMKLKNARVGLRVRSKHGLHDEGTITAINADGTFTVTWHYQDGNEVSEGNRPEDVSISEHQPNEKCPTCGRPRE